MFVAARRHSWAVAIPPGDAAAAAFGAAAGLCNKPCLANRLWWFRLPQSCARGAHFVRAAPRTAFLSVTQSGKNVDALAYLLRKTSMSNRDWESIRIEIPYDSEF